MIQSNDWYSLIKSIITDRTGLSDYASMTCTLHTQ